MSRPPVTHCLRGHEFTEENTYRPPGSPHRRHCLECQRRRRGKPKAKKPKTHCPHGHELTPENISLPPSGTSIVCKTCKKLWHDRWRKSKGKGYRADVKTHCPKGHEYTPENTHIVPKTKSRVCRRCQRERQKQLDKGKRLTKSGERYLYCYGPRFVIPGLPVLDRKGQVCIVLETGAMNTARVQFEDGTEYFVRRSALRKL